MGIAQMPNRRMYWQIKTRVDLVADAMALNRFNDILSIMHYNDNNSIPDRNSPLFNRAYKIQPLINYFRQRFAAVVSKETFLSVDEQILPFKGKHSLKRYNHKKPKKWGYKTWALAGISGYVYDFQKTQCRRFDRKKKEYITIDRPATVTVFHKFMGGVDKTDMMLSLYRTKCRTRK